ncbi:GtrA family protein [Dactylosporangium sp. NPDC000521]|uniref:GtrA family protein n=1 Tax=Dactylosporangium sp. NPDC000521 TaxID=3363975 RepID=UPI0036C8A0C8
MRGRVVDAWRHPLVRFVAFAGLGFGFDVGLLLLLKAVTPLPAFACVTVAFWATYAVNFVLNRYFTFDASHRAVGPQVARFVVQVLGDYALTVGVVLGLQVLGVHLAVGRVAAGATTLVFNYVMYRWWTFHRPATGGSGTDAGQVVAAARGGASAG